METEKVSLITGLAPKNKYWAIVCYVTVALTLILSITILILVQYLAGLNLLNQFLFYAEVKRISQISIRA